MKIIDCFTFYNEVKMLEFRLQYLYDTVDFFVLVEATQTHAGNPKPLFFENNKLKYSKYLNKIIHVIVNDLPNPPIHKLKFINTRICPDYSSIRREIYQRTCIDRGIQRLNLHDDDVILISDLDEIPDRNMLKSLQMQDGIRGLLQDLYYYNFTCKHADTWTQARILNVRTYKKYQNPQTIRTYQPDHTEYISNAGWHLSYFGDPEFIANKLKNFCHNDQFDRPEYNNLETIQQRIKEGVDLFCRSNETFIKIPIEENTYLPENYIFLTMT